MASEKLGLVQTQRELNQHQQAQPQLVFQDSFTRGGPTPQRHPTAVGDPGPKTTRELTGLIRHQHNYFHQASDFRRSIFSEDHPPSHPQSGHNWNSSSRVSATPSGEGSEDEDGEDDDDEDEDDSVVQGLLTVNNKNNEKVINNNNSSNNSENTGNQKIKHSSSFGLKEGNVVGQSGNNGISDMRNSVTVAEVEGGMYYGQYLKGAEGLNGGGQKDIMVENGVGFSGRKEGSYSNESGESLRAILADPITGALMDNAMILPCGHSFGSDGMQHVLRMNACYTCSHATSEVSVSPNLSLRAAVQAFRREEELHASRASKRRKERYDQEKGIYGDSTPSDLPRGSRGVQFPFAVSDRVLIKGNKRTPQRFVGREAIVTTQCLNGWYVVKTLDNAESVKLQYRSLAKVPGNQSVKSMAMPTPTGVTPNWL